MKKTLLLLLLPFSAYAQSSRPPVYNFTQQEIDKHNEADQNHQTVEPTTNLTNYKKPTKKIQFLIKSFYDEQIQNPYPSWPMSVEQKILSDGRHKYYYYITPIEQGEQGIENVLQSVKMIYQDAFIVRYVDGKRIN